MWFRSKRLTAQRANSDRVDEIIADVVLSNHDRDDSEKLTLLLPIAHEQHPLMPWLWYTICESALKLEDDAVFLEFSERFCRFDQTNRLDYRVGKIHILVNRIQKLHGRGESIQNEVAELLAQDPPETYLDWLRDRGVENLTAEPDTFTADKVQEFALCPSPQGVVHPPITHSHFAVTEALAAKPRLSVIENVEYLAVHGEAAAVRPGPTFFVGLSRSENLRGARDRLEARGAAPVRLGGTAVVLSDQFLDSNYCHWMCDWFPRFLLAREMFGPIDYVCARMRGTKFQIETLTKLGGLTKRQILPDKPVSWYSFDRLVTVDNNSVAMTHPTWMANPAVIDLVRNTVLAKVPAPRTKLRRLYVTRADAGTRMVANEQALTNLLARYGVETISLTGLSVVQQAAAMANCEFLISPHGAGLTNMMFMPPGGVVVELFHYRAGSEAYPRLAQGCGHHYYYMSLDAVEGSTEPKFNKPTVQSQRHHYHDVWVDIAALDGILRQIF
jgi:capsular polysaccharide biosynthesis protein